MSGLRILLLRGRCSHLTPRSATPPSSLHLYWMKEKQLQRLRTCLFVALDSFSGLWVSALQNIHLRVLCRPFLFYLSALDWFFFLSGVNSRWGVGLSGGRPVDLRWHVDTLRLKPSRCYIKRLPTFTPRRRYPRGWFVKRPPRAQSPQWVHAEWKSPRSLIITFSVVIKKRILHKVWIMCCSVKRRTKASAFNASNKKKE